MTSVWMPDRPQLPAFAPLAGSAEVDTVVVGGGITGTTAALLLSDAGQRVALLESGHIGAGNTGGSTGNLYGTLSRDLAAVRASWGEDVLREVTALRLQAVDLVERNVLEYGLDCAFARRPLQACVASGDEHALAALDAEYHAAEAAGLQPAWGRGVPELPFPVRRVLRIEGQAQFNPYLYTVGLARLLAGRGVRVHEDSAVLYVDAGAGRVCTVDGELHAKAVVFATHSPLGFNLLQAEMQPFREYGIAATLASGTYPDGIYWIRDHDRSIRSYRHHGREHLVVVGEIHKTGEGGDGIDYAQRLRDYASGHFDIAGFDAAWSAQQLRSADHLPYIGPSAHRNVLVATGFAADGLTWGTVAASALAELLLGHDPRAVHLCSPRRFTPMKSARGWTGENASVLRHLVGDRLGGAELHSLSDVMPGEGRIVELHGHKHAVYRALDDTLTVLSPVCPHLKCHVAWNAEAQSWDCPCHGSRFRADGTVIEGPAVRPLEARVLPGLGQQAPAPRSHEAPARPEPPPR